MIADFQKVADAGIKTLRILKGCRAYELVSGENYTRCAAPYPDADVDWTRATGLKIWIDLNGALGTQNNSGRRISQPGWQQGDAVSRTLQTIKAISEKYAQLRY
jgi:glucan 1,3-beta-glucosidase